MKPLLVYITGPGHSGSTLLGLLLNNSPRVQSLGEVHRLKDYAHGGEPCTCGRPLRSCPFWQEVDAELRRRLGAAPDEALLATRDMMLRPEQVGPIGTALQKTLLVLGSRSLDRLAPWVAASHRRAAAFSLQCYDAIRAASGCPVLVDSSKDPRRLKMLYYADPASFRVLYMLRDGRAVAASELRRDAVPISLAARRWLDYHRRTRLALRGIPERQILRVRYERLCAAPGAVLREVCDFLGLPFDESMLQLRKGESHDIGGNPMRFDSDESEIRPDERWRGELSAEELRDFEAVAGRLNRRLGYAARDGD